MNLFHQEPKVVRQMIREGKITSPTSGMCAGYAQGNLVVLPKEFAYDFLLFTQRNPKPCPVLEVSDVGSREFSITAKGSDIARDIPKYRVYRDGVMQGEYEDVSSFWRDDLVSFLLGCSFSFEAPMIEEGIEVRHITENCNVLMYITNIPCRPAGIFSGPVVVSMRPIPHEKVVKAVTVTERMPQVHGTPIHIGDPEYIGIRDIHHPDFGDPVTIKEGEIPVFWACGVTPQAVVMNVKPPFVITHAPGHMFITDMKNSQL
ncbi:putative hydro-lyase [Faecalispora jeddahensis]|uniref:putative hydro-lyase n=1 Tax=Faecalispora jeddahensis TaxID=1414721 RepID=UPI0028A9F733|nr:putative hydro-lyase [Faecalispora jeddahensis]